MNINVSTTTIEGLGPKLTKQTKLIIVPAHSFGINVSKKDELKEALENFKKLFRDKDEYIFILDYRQGAYFDVIDLEGKREGRSYSINPYDYNYPLFNPYSLPHEKSIDWTKVYCDANEVKSK